MNSDLHQVVVVGQTPPPHHGQAIMIQRLLEQTYEGVELHHVRLAFSREINEVGVFRWSKIPHLVAVILRIIRMRVRTGGSSLYYHPAGPEKIPIYRDMAILICVRWMFRRTIFHFQAGGLTDVYTSLNPVEKFLFRAAYNDPDLVIRLSTLLPEDGRRLHAKHEAIIPNAIPDLSRPLISQREEEEGALRILFVGVVRRSKGIEVLLQAAGCLRKRGLPFRLEIVGDPASREFAEEARTIAVQEGISDVVNWRGVLIDDEKDRIFSSADIFCFPSFFESEATPVVLMEAMRASLPVVSSTWRGIPDIVQDEVTGILVPIQDADAVAGALERLMIDKALRRSMGAEGRRVFEERFTLDRYQARIQEALRTVSI